MIVCAPPACQASSPFRLGPLPFRAIPTRVSSVAPPAAALAASQTFASVLRERPYRGLWLSGLRVNGALVGLWCVATAGLLETVAGRADCQPV